MWETESAGLKLSKMENQAGGQNYLDLRWGEGKKGGMKSRDLKKF